ncbi:flavo protein WrbA [Linderina pennispora]|uniref:Flavo protein WrbA n=1 Tax=Linderina pennispora TaxID=61395 RepID=A0A1Y1VSN9_9FUNG|nr:flavo protein WrbA [Linderina pennispora]ORX64299.1 flavo protein WrbA [Linderina pennispora]
MARPKVFVVFYSTYGHVHTISKSIKEGLEKSALVDVEVYQFPETLSESVLQSMYAPPKPDIPVITVDKLAEADGFLFGFPTRFGSAPAQVKAFFDSTGSLWVKGALSGKPAGIFFSTASQHGGQETTAFSFLPVLAHHGMVFVPALSTSAGNPGVDQVAGGSPWGAGTVAGSDGARQPTEYDLAAAVAQGETFANIAAKLSA